MAIKNTEIRIHCFGKFWEAFRCFEFDDNEKHLCYRFIFDKELQARNPCHFALFADYAGLLDSIYGYPKHARLLLLQEPGSSRHYVEHSKSCNKFAKVFTHDRRLLENPSLNNVYEMPFGTNWLAPQVEQIVPPLPKSKLLSYMGALHPDAPVGSGHHLRNQIAQFCLDRGTIDCFGKGIRWIENIRESLEGYAFSVAVENCQQDYYFTEKLINCLLMDTVPIYRGCKGIDRYFDPRGMILFDTFEEFRTIVTELTFERYEAMLPYVRANREQAIANHWATSEGIYRRVAIEGFKGIKGLGLSVRYPSKIRRLLAKCLRKYLPF